MSSVLTSRDHITMHSGLLIVVLATAVTASVAQYPSNCHEVVLGTKAGQPVEEQTVYLSAGIRTWEVQISTEPPCGQTNGVSSLVCDYDVAPEAMYKDRNHLTVNRQGNLLGQGSVKATVYCQN